MALRERANLTREKLAEYLGMDQNLFNKCENGERNFSTVMLERISELFGCPINMMLGNEIPTETFDYAFHSIHAQDMDLETIAAINRITLNLLEMQRLWIVGHEFRSRLIPG